MKIGDFKKAHLPNVEAPFPDPLYRMRINKDNRYTFSVTREGDTFVTEIAEGVFPKDYVITTLELMHDGGIAALRTIEPINTWNKRTERSIAFKFNLTINMEYDHE